MFENIPEGFEELDADRANEVRKALGLPEDADIVGARVAAGSAKEILPQLFEDAGPDEVVSGLVAWMGSMALRHTLDGHCDCGAEAHFDEIFDKLGQAIEMAKEALRPLYLNTYEGMAFTQEVEADLSGLEVISEDDLEVLRQALAEDEDSE